MTTTIEELLEEAIDKNAVPIEEDELQNEKDVKKLKQRKPPSDGLCRRCGQNKPVNRLMLCYPCWVKAELEKRGWREGEPHPDWCACEGSSDHKRLSDGN
ncbi:MAG: hypothetical protein HY921_01230 [Elusimicrobia bacterium]|nr:hypothetical protein [Elusimicrobiota bacterium]